VFRAAAARHQPAAGRPRAARTGLNLRAGMAVGLYGGSFNPAHEGHAHVAETARRRLGLDRVIWLVAPQNPLKSAAGTASLAERLAGARRWARGPRMIVSDVERRIGERYTIDTVRWLKRRFPDVRFVWIMGADSLATFQFWRGWIDLARTAPIAIVSRPGVALRSRFSPLARRFAAYRLPAGAARTLAGRTPPAWTYLPAPYHFVSSTSLRNSRLT
jgi:nicotinate-nucleotide adenylyltransferase